MTAREYRKRAREKMFPRDAKTGYGTFLIGMLRQLACVMLASLLIVPVFFGIGRVVDIALLQKKMELIPSLPGNVSDTTQIVYKFLSVLVQDTPPPDELAWMMFAIVFALLCFQLVFAFVKWGQKTMAVALMRGGLQSSHATTGVKNIWRMTCLMLWQQTYISLWSFLFLIPGIRAFYSYCMAPYLLIDNPDWSPRKCIAESKRMMEGRRWSFFCLQLSFIWWWLLAKIVEKFCGGFSSWLLVPYTETAAAAFYEHLLDCEEADDTIILGDGPLQENFVSESPLQ